MNTEIPNYCKTITYGLASIIENFEFLNAENGHGWNEWEGWSYKEIILDLIQGGYGDAIFDDVIQGTGGQIVDESECAEIIMRAIASNGATLLADARNYDNKYDTFAAREIMNNPDGDYMKMQNPS